MKKVVFTVKDDVCARNGKDPNATDLFAVMGHYGTIESYDTVIAKVAAEQNSIIVGLNQKISSMEQSSAAEAELPVLRAIRDLVDASVSIVKDENAQLKESLKKADEKAKNLSVAIGETLAAYNRE